MWKDLLEGISLLIGICVPFVLLVVWLTKISSKAAMNCRAVTAVKEDLVRHAEDEKRGEEKMEKGISVLEKRIPLLLSYSEHADICAKTESRFVKIVENWQEEAKNSMMLLRQDIQNSQRLLTERMNRMDELREQAKPDLLAIITQANQQIFDYFDKKIKPDKKG